MIHFGTGGFRGVIADEFTKDNLERIAEGIVSLYRETEAKKPILVGYDFRFCSENAAKWMACVLAGNHIPVLLSSTPSPTPAIMEESKRLDHEFGIMITASHNPYWFNGVKLFQKEGMDAEKSLTDHLETLIAEVEDIQRMDLDTALSEGLITYYSPLEPYLDNIQNFVDVEAVKNGRKLKVLADPIFGTGALTLKETLNRMGIEDVTVLHGERDPYFHGLLPNPIEKNMEADRKVLSEGKYDFCLGTDSDCDRLSILDEKGNYVDANEIMACTYYYLVKYKGRKGDIVKNLATSNLIDAVAEKLGFRCHEVDVGFKNISQGIKDYDALLGGESSGGLTLRGYIYGKDSTFATALFAEMVSVMDKPVSEIVEEVRDFASFHKVMLEDSAPYKDKGKLLSVLKEKDPCFKRAIVKKALYPTNIKYYFENGDWALVRFSGTEPLIRLFYETENENRALAKEEIQTMKTFLAEEDGTIIS